MTVVVVDPKDIREDAEQALMGLTRLWSKKFEEVVDEAYASRSNASVGFWASFWDGGRNHKSCPRKYTRREIGLWVAELYRGEKSQNNPLDWWEDGGLALKMFDKSQRPVRTFITAAESLNAVELQVDADTLHDFEEAYKEGSNLSRTEE